MGNKYVLDIPAHTIYKEPKKEKVIAVQDVTKITSAHFDKYSSQVITAHDMRDYRRTDFEFNLLESISLPIDNMMEEVLQIDPIYF